jgi:hypothetical protein
VHKPVMVECRFLVQGNLECSRVELEAKRALKSHSTPADGVASSLYQDENDVEDHNTTTLCSSIPSWWNHSKQSPLLKLNDDDSCTSTTGTPPTVSRRSSSSSCGGGTPSSSSFWSSHQDEDNEEEDSEGYLSSNSNSPDSSCVPKAVLSYSSSWSSFTMDDSSSSSSSSCYYYTQDELNMPNGHLPTIESDLRPSHDNLRTFHVVTTAALPWQTGTAVNPLLRAAHLSKMNRPYVSNNKKSTVTLVVPWLESSQDRVYLYGEEWKDKQPSDQDAYIRDWLRQKANLPLEADLSQGGIQIQFYNARWHKGMNSIFAMGDIESSIPQEQAGEYKKILYIYCRRFCTHYLFILHVLILYSPLSLS